MPHRKTQKGGNISSAFIDLASLDMLEKALYGLEGAISYFTRTTTSCSWFTMVPCVLSRKSGNPTFGADWSVSVSRAGDYLLSNWLRFELPAVTVSSSKTDTYVSWTPNVAHNLIRDCSITFNDLSAHHIDNYYLDFLAAFTVPGGKQAGYNEMIGNTPELTTPAKSLPATILNLPLPLFYTKDTGVSLSVAALPYNDISITFQFRELEDLLTAWEIDTNGAVARSVNVSDDLTSTPELHDVQVWANYALVNNASRKKIGQTPRDVLIEQFQHVPRQTFSPATNNYSSYDIRFSHSIKCLMWGAENTTIPSVRSNYTTKSPEVSMADDGTITVQHAPGKDPLDNVSLMYENTERLSGMSSEYFSHVQPYYQPKCVIPTQKGMHMYSYSLDIVDPDPMGSTNFGRLTNVTLAPEGTDEAVTADENGASFRFVIFGINHNIVRLSGGAFGFPFM
jgi:hypothetical protein